MIKHADGMQITEAPSRPTVTVHKKVNKMCMWINYVCMKKVFLLKRTCSTKYILMKQAMSDNKTRVIEKLA